MKKSLPASASSASPDRSGFATGQFHFPVGPGLSLPYEASTRVFAGHADASPSSTQPAGNGAVDNDSLIKKRPLCARHSVFFNALLLVQADAFPARIGYIRSYSGAGFAPSFNKQIN